MWRQRPRCARSLCTQDELLGLFAGDAVGRNVVLDPATQADMRGHEVVEKPSLEIFYDAA